MKKIYVVRLIFKSFFSLWGFIRSMRTITIVGLIVFSLFVNVTAGSLESYLTYSKGLIAAKNGDMEYALQEYQRALALDNNASQIYRDMAFLYWQIGKPEEAIESAEKFQKLSDENLSTYLFMGNFYMLIGDAVKARESWEKALEMDPENETAILYLAAYHSSNSSSPENAIKYWSKFIEKEPDSAEGYYQLGIAQEKIGRIKEAKESVIKAISINPDRPEAYFSMAQIYEKEGNFLAAAQEYEQYLKFVPDNFTVLVYLGGLYYRLKNYTAAEKKFLEAKKINSTDKSIYFWLGILAEEKKDWKSAIDYFEFINKSEENPVILTRLSYYYSAVKKFEEAIKCIKKVLKMDDKNPNSYYLLGLSYFDLKKYRSSEKYFNKALELKPNQEEIYFHKGVLYDHWGKFDKAVVEFETAIKLNPAYSQALNYLGYSFADRNMRLDYALELINRALILDPDNSSFIDSLGWVYYRQGLYDDAVIEFKKALEKSQDPVIFEHLGDAYVALGDNEKAWDSYMKALQKNPENKKIIKKVKKLEKLILPALIQKKLFKKAIGNLQQINSLKANFTITGRTKGSVNFRLAGIFQYLRPNKTRIDILGNLFAPQFVVIENKGLHIYPDAMDKSISSENKIFFNKISKYLNSDLLTMFDSDNVILKQDGHYIKCQLADKTVVIDKNEGVIKKFFIKDKVVINFNKYLNEEGVYFPQNISVDYSVEKIKADIKFQKIIINKDIDDKIFIFSEQKSKK